MEILLQSFPFLISFLVFIQIDDFGSDLDRELGFLNDDNDVEVPTYEGSYESEMEMDDDVLSSEEVYDGNVRSTQSDRQPHQPLKEKKVGKKIQKVTYVETPTTTSTLSVPRDWSLETAISQLPSRPRGT